MAVREKRARIADPATTSRLALAMTTIPSRTASGDRRRQHAFLHPRPGRAFVSPRVLGLSGVTRSDGR